MEPSDVRVLVERARAGDRPAFDELALKFRPAITALIVRRLGGTLRQAASVEDVLQETMVRAFGSLDRFKWPEGEGESGGAGGGDRATPFLRWLGGIAVRIILEHARRLRRPSPIALDRDIPDGDDVSPGRALARRERLERFEAALGRLSEDHRTVLRLVRLEGLPLGEVARRMGRSPNAISQLALRALRSLRRELEEMSRTGSLRLPVEGLGTSGEESKGGGRG
jgi:RNA polymerase sigma-70 factor, ECF subfamily